MAERVEDISTHNSEEAVRDNPTTFLATMQKCRAKKDEASFIDEVVFVLHDEAPWRSYSGHRHTGSKEQMVTAHTIVAHTVLCRRSGSGEEICTILSVSPDITLKTEYMWNASNVIEDDET